MEANGVLHPRGAEYNTQYVVDGFPVVDNRSRRVFQNIYCTTSPKIGCCFCT